MNQLENCQARYLSNTWMGRTSNGGPDEFEPSKFDCNKKDPQKLPEGLNMFDGTNLTLISEVDQATCLVCMKDP